MSETTSASRPRKSGIRGSSIVLVVVGLLLIVGAGVFRAAVVPELTKLPSDLESTSEFSVEMSTFDPSAFALGEPVEVTSERVISVTDTEGDTALLNNTTVTKTPAGDSTSDFTYAIDRTDFSQVDPPSGAEVTDQKGGLVLGHADPTKDSDVTVYETDTQSAVPMEFVANEDMGGIETLHFTGTTDAKVLDPAMLQTLQGSVAQLTGGDGSVLPVAALQQLVSGAPTEVQQKFGPVLPLLGTADVPLAYTAAVQIDIWLEPKLGIPVRTDRSTTFTLNLEVGGSSIPAVPLAQTVANQSDESATDMADYLGGLNTKVALAETWVPLGVGALGLILIAIGLLRRRAK